MKILDKRLLLAYDAANEGRKYDHYSGRGKRWRCKDKVSTGMVDGEACDGADVALLGHGQAGFCNELVEDSKRSRGCSPSAGDGAGPPTKAHELAEVLPLNIN